MTHVSPHTKPTQAQSLEITARRTSIGGFYA
jgi:hypothetical protein